MKQGRISVQNGVGYYYYSEDHYDSLLKKMRNKIINSNGIRLDKSTPEGLLGTEIKKSFLCETCKKIIIDLGDIL